MSNIKNLNFYCMTGLHQGVFQSLDSKFCSHTFWVPKWDSTIKQKPDNVKVMTQQMMDDPDEKFFDAILIFPEHFDKVKNIDKPILVYFVTNGRPTGGNYEFAKRICDSKRVVPIFLSTSTRISHGIYEGFHKTIYHGVDDEFWSGWEGNDKLLVSVKNNFNTRNPDRFSLYKDICDGQPNIVLGSNQDLELGYVALRDKLRTCRAFVNIEIVGSPFDTSCVEAMMLGMPIISTDSESSGEFIRNGIEGYISNNVNFLKRKVRDILNDHAMAKELGQNARKHALLRFSKKQFNMAWDELF